MKLGMTLLKAALLICLLVQVGICGKPGGKPAHAPKKSPESAITMDQDESGSYSLPDKAKGDRIITMDSSGKSDVLSIDVARLTNKGFKESCASYSDEDSCNWAPVLYNSSKTNPKIKSVGSCSYYDNECHKRDKFNLKENFTFKGATYERAWVQEGIG
ncbi:MAG: hypothetical protein K2Q34_01325 [Alphaproteobacteria bacterium]|nr:hypothetical protein [Alphaproteobacteria bacterium]